MRQITWPTVALLAIITAGVVALAALTNWGSGDILAVAGVLGGIGAAQVAGGVMVGGVTSRVDQLHEQTTAQDAVLEHISHKVNGELDSRLANTAQTAAETVLSELRKQGVIS